MNEHRLTFILAIAFGFAVLMLWLHSPVVPSVVYDVEQCGTQNADGSARVVPCAAFTP